MLLCIVQIFCYGNTKYYFTADEYAYNHYSEVLKGELSEEKEKFFQNERDRFETVEREQEELYARCQAGEISVQEYQKRSEKLQVNDAKKNALAQVSVQYDTLKKYQNRGEYVEYINQKGWDRLFGVIGRQQYLWNFGKLSFFLILALLPVFLKETRTGVNMLIQSSRYGERALNITKTVIGSIYSAGMGVLAFCPYMVTVKKNFDMTVPGGSVHSILSLNFIPGKMPLMGWMVLYIAGTLICAVLTGLVILEISKRFKKN